MVTLARQIVSRLDRDLPQPILAAGTDGTIQIKWQKSEMETSIFIYPDCSLEYLWKKNGRHGSGDLSVNQVANLFVDF